MKQYLKAVETVLREGTRKENRTGVDTISTFDVHYKIDLREGFPLLTTKKVSWKNIVIENLWFLSGNTDIGFLKKHKCKFWDPWADEDGNVPSAYGHFWRHFPTEKDGAPVYSDQIRWLGAELRRNPMSRRLWCSAWSPGNAQNSKLPPCHLGWALNVQNMGPIAELDFADGVPEIFERHLCLHLTQRSCDMAIGVPYNIAGYAFILSLFSKFSGIPVGIFGHTLIDAHVYTKKPDGSQEEYDHIPSLREQLKREPLRLPTLHIDDRIKGIDDIEALINSDMSTGDIMDLFPLVGYDPHPAIKYRVAV